MRFDLFDLLTAVGLVLIGAAIVLAFGLAAGLAYAGLVLVILGIAGAAMVARPREG